MLFSILKTLFRQGAAADRAAACAPDAAPWRLHIGGQIAHPDWKILNVQPGPQVDFVGDCADLRQFADASVTEIYASHVLEHLGFKHEMPAALTEFHRVLVPGGGLRIGVPDLAVLCALYLDPALDAEDRYQVMRMLYGGQLNNADFHCAGYDAESLALRLQKAGFVGVERVDAFRLFDDSSNFSFKGRPISLNLRARKGSAA